MERHIGLLDRKLHVVNKNTKDSIGVTQVVFDSWVRQYDTDKEAITAIDSIFAKVHQVI